MDSHYPRLEKKESAYLHAGKRRDLLGVDADRLERGAHRGDLDDDALRAVQVQHVQLSENAAEKCFSFVSLFVSGAAGKKKGKRKCCGNEF